MTAAPLRRVFVVEDDAKINAVLCDYLASHGYEPQAFHHGNGVVAAVRAAPPAAIILDLMLPGVDGMTLCARLRGFSAVPILMLTARVAEIDRLKGLDGGADDYVSKPFSAREIMARINALIRRAEGRVTVDPAATLRYFIDDPGRRAAFAGQWLALSPSEFSILAALVRQPGRVFSRDQLLDQLGDRFSDRTLETNDRAIDSHIKNLRRKIAAIDPEARCITSVYGSGYRFDP
jgi:two-component system response regulator BaeR